MSRTARLTTGSITRHLIEQTIPAIIAGMAMTSVGIVDAYFIGRLGGDELAAMSFIFPVAQALMSLGVGVLASIASVVSRRLGAGELERAQRAGNLGMVLAAILGLLMALALILLRDQLFGAMQAEARLMPVIDEYMVPYSLGFPLVLLMMGLNGNLRAQGEAKRSSAIMIAFSLLNVVLDPLLIDGIGVLPSFGVAGAAYATVIGWIVAASLGLWLLQHTDIPFRPTILKDCHFGENIRALARVAGPASIANSINPMGLSVLTALLAAEGSAAVAGYGAAGRLQAFAIVPLLGLSGSIGAIVGQNWGANRRDRARSALLQSGLFCLGYGLAVATIMVLAREHLAHLFADDPAIVASFTTYLVTAAWGYAGFGMLIVTNGSLNAIDRSGTALMLSVSRVALIMLPTGYVLRQSWGAQGVFAAELAANIGGGLLAALLVFYLFRPGQGDGVQGDVPQAARATS